jgi:hypothetical protein
VSFNVAELSISLAKVVGESVLDVIDDIQEKITELLEENGINLDGDFVEAERPQAPVQHQAPAAPRTEDEVTVVLTHRDGREERFVARGANLNLTPSWNGTQAGVSVTGVSYAGRA